MDNLTESSTPQTAPLSRQVPFREDCWTEEATATLVDAWGRRYLDLNRGNLRQKDWQEVADAVNARHGHTKKTRRTDVQCKNRIDTLKKKYKVERSKILESNGALTSSWQFFSRLEYLIGPNAKQNQNNKPTLMSVPTPFQPTPILSLPSPPMAVPLAYRNPMSSSAVVTPLVLPQKRPVAAEESYFRRNYSAMAAAAAAAAEEDEEEEEEEGESEGSEENRGVEEEEAERGEGGGMRKLAKAIERFGEIYEKVESMKQRQMVELEKQRMQFAKDLEVQRMKLFMDMQVQLEKAKRPRRSGSSEGSGEENLMGMLYRSWGT